MESRKDTLLALNYVPGIVVQNCEEEQKNTPNAVCFTFFHEHGCRVEHVDEDG